MKFRIAAICLVITFVTSTMSLAETAKLPLEAFSAMPVVSMLRISPDGSRIAYRSLVKDSDYLIIKDMSSGKILGGVNLGSINPNNAYFIDQNRIILIASENKRIAGYRGQHNVSSAFIYDLQTKTIEQLLVPGRGVYLGQANLGRVVGLSPDKKYAYMPAYVGEVSDEITFNLVRVDLNKPRRLKRAKRGRNDTIDYFVDENGEVLARERYNNYRNIHSIDALIDNDWVEIFTEITELRSKNFVGLTPDRKSLVLVASPDGEQDAYFTMTLADGTISKPLFHRKDASIEGVLTDLQRVVYGVRYSGFRPDYAFFSKRLNATYKAIKEAMPGNTFRIIDHTADWKKILFYIEGDQSAGDYLMFENGGFNYVAGARPDIKPELVAPVREYTYQARDGLTIPTLLTYPLAHVNKPENMPAILMPHGGPESHDKFGFQWMAQYFANRGYLVIQPQFRGSSGFGHELTRQGYGEWGKKMQDDLSDGVNHLAKKGMIDPDKVCIVGWSYGGYAALAGASFTPELFKCVISINGVSDLEEMMRTEKRDYGKHHWVVSYWNKVIADENVADDFMESISPINHVKKITAPVLLIHGEDDNIVPIDQSEEMADALESADKKFKFIEIKDEGHSINYSNVSRLKVLKAIDEFLSANMQ